MCLTSVRRKSRFFSATFSLLSLFAQYLLLIPSLPLYIKFFCLPLSTAFFRSFAHQKLNECLFCLSLPHFYFFPACTKHFSFFMPVDPLYAPFSAGASFDGLDSHSNGFLQINNSLLQYTLTYTYSTSFPTDLIPVHVLTQILVSSL